MAEPKDIAKLTVMLSAAYPNWTPNEFTNEIYFQDLKDIPTELLFTAAQYCRTSITRDQRFAPSAGEIRAAASVLHSKAHGVPTALEAWNEVCRAEKPYPPDYVVYRGGERVEAPVHAWSHPLVRKVAIDFGWPDFPTFENESTERAHFFRQYEAAQQNILNEEFLVPEVKHWIEAENPVMKQLVSAMKRLESAK